jgi:RNA polymerase sigma-70 factor (ECF subfamily)
LEKSAPLIPGGKEFWKYIARFSFLARLVGRRSMESSALIETALRGDAESFEMLIPLFSRRLFSVAYAVLQDAEEAEDVVQETFLAAYKARWRLRKAGKFGAWLTTVARNRARDLLRRRRTVPLSGEEPELAAEPEPPTAGAEMQRHVHAALAALPEHFRLAVTLRYLEGLDHESIRAALGISDGALRGILGRALGKMRKTLRPIIAATDS